MDEKAKRADFDEILAVMKLTRDDIEANRQGDFVQTQLNQVRELSAKFRNRAMVVSLLTLLYLVWGLVFRSVMFEMSGFSIVLVINLGLTVIFTTWLLVKWYRLRLDTIEQSTDTSTGVLTIHKVQLKNGDFAQAVQIAGIRHGISQEAYTLLETRQGEPFTVYYASHSRTMLSLEPDENSKETA